jgi:molybdopterin synthase sulfur carrier subunit
MKVRLLFFSVLQDITGAAELSWTCAPDAQVKDLLLSLYERWPKLGDWDSSLLIALDQTYVKRDAPLTENAEVALMPPVQGG